MVKHGDSGIGTAYRAASREQTREGLRRCYLVYKVTVDIQNGGFSGRLMYDMSTPDFLKHRF
jgi:hypothetical protein